MNFTAPYCQGILPGIEERLFDAESCSRKRANHLQSPPGMCGTGPLITDVVMPGLDSASLVERYSRMIPSMKVLYLSGCADDALVRRGAMCSTVLFLHTLFTMRAIHHERAGAEGAPRAG